MVRTECQHALVTMHTVVKGQYVLSVCIECELVDMRWHCSGVPHCGCGAECRHVNVVVVEW